MSQSVTRPIIACNCGANDDKAVLTMRYVCAVLTAGGVPCVVPPIYDEEAAEAYARRFDGFLFTGGGDIDPSLYGEEKQPSCGEPDKSRDSSEYLLLSKALVTGKPMLGICRGAQVFNAALGGTLYQHIDGHVQSEPREKTTHAVTLSGCETLISAAGGSRLYVNSFHHQAVKAPAPSLKICAVSDDGINEAVYMPEHRFFVGVQWHPECCFNDDKASAALFKAFIDACRL